MAGKRYRVLLIAGDRTHQEGYAAAFAADPRSEIVAVADEAGVSDQRHEWNKAMADRYNVPSIADLDVGVQLAAAATEVVLAAYRSAALGEPVQPG
jgi:hypothetical protein